MKITNVKYHDGPLVHITMLVSHAERGDFLLDLAESTTDEFHGLVVPGKYRPTPVLLTVTPTDPESEHVAAITAEFWENFQQNQLKGTYTNAVGPVEIPVMLLGTTQSVGETYKGNPVVLGVVMHTHHQVKPVRPKNLHVQWETKQAVADVLMAMKKVSVEMIETSSLQGGVSGLKLHIDVYHRIGTRDRWVKPIEHFTALYGPHTPYTEVRPQSGHLTPRHTAAAVPSTHELLEGYAGAEGTKASNSND